jgi:PAS domain S-box-containing protein
MTNKFPNVFANGGECGKHLQNIDWGRSPLGHPDDWPCSLRTAVQLILNSQFPMMIHWGKDLITFYNDAYAPSLGSKHPGNLGRPAREWWSEMWDQLEPIFDQVLGGVPYYVEDAAYHPDRFGGRQTAYFTHCHSPMWGDSGEIEGIFLVVKETTRQVVAEDALKKSNNELQAQVAKSVNDRDRIWNLSVDLLGVADMDGVWLSVNPAWTTLLGWSASDIVGRTSQWLEHPEDRASTTSEISKLSTGETTFSFINRFMRRDGSYRTLSWRAVPADGLLYCVARDMTPDIDAAMAQARLSNELETANQGLSEQRAADEVQRVLKHELSHRLKNVMSIVQAIILQSARSGGSTEDIVKAITSRVQALAQAQDILIRDQDDGADLLALVKAALRPHVGLEESRIILDGPPIAVPAQQGLGLALAINELATNASKYGSLSVAEGKVLLRWLAQDGKFQLEWKEEGGPPVTASERQGFGTRLLTRIVPTYFGGAAAIAPTQEGISYTLTGTLR